MGQSIGNYGELQFRLQQQQQEEDRQAAMNALKAQQEYTLHTTLQGMADRAAYDRSVATVNAQGDRLNESNAAVDARQRAAFAEQDKKALDATWAVSMAKFTATGGKEDPSKFPRTYDGVAKLQQATADLVDAKQKSGALNLLGQLDSENAVTQKEILRLGSMTHADQLSAAITAATTIKYGWTDAAKMGIAKAFLANPDETAATLGTDFPKFRDAYNAAVAQTQQSKEGLNKDELGALRAQLVSNIQTRAKIRQEKPEWFAAMGSNADLGVANPGAPQVSAPPAPDPLAIIKAKYPPVSDAATSVANPTPAVSVAAPMIDPALFRTQQAQQLQKEIALRTASGQSPQDAFSAALTQQQLAQKMAGLKANALTGMSGMNDAAKAFILQNQDQVKSRWQQAEDERKKRLNDMLGLFGFGGQ